VSDTSTAVKIEEISPVKKKILFDIPWVDVKKELDTVYRSVAKSAKIKGFRQGRIPRDVLEVYYKEHAENEVISNLFKKSYQEALEKNDIVPLTQPYIDQTKIEKNKDFTFTATVEVEPFIEPKGYTDLELERDEFEVTEGDVDERLERIRHMFATLEDVGKDRGVKEGDLVTLDFEGTVAGKSLKELTAKDYSMEVGRGTIFPGFEEQLIGTGGGESKQIQLKFPDEYPAKHIAGKEVLFTVNLKNIREKKLPNLDENFIRNFDKFESIEELKEHLCKSLQDENHNKADLALKELIKKKILETNEFEVPSSFVERQLYYIMADTQQKMISSGMAQKEATEFSLKFRDHFRDEATNIVKSILLLKAIAQKESITVDEKEVEDRLKDIAREITQEYDSLRESFEKSGKIDHVRDEILNEKTFDFIKGKSNITVVKKVKDENIGGK